jgi:flagellin
MAVVINTNPAASVAANHLRASSAAMQRSINRLSSGLKITAPSDDAGGLAVSMKLSASVRRLEARKNNYANATSFLQTQDGVLKVLGRIVDRVSELKVLHLDPTKSASDRENYDEEYTQLRAELSTLGSEKFNGIGLFGTKSLVVGSESDPGANVIEGADLMTGRDVSWASLSGVAPGAGWVASAGIVNATTYTGFHGTGSLTSVQHNITGPFTMSFSYAMVGHGAGSAFLSMGGSSSLDLQARTGPTDTAYHTMVVTADADGNATWSFNNGAQTGALAGFVPLGGGAVSFSASGYPVVDMHVSSNFTMAGVAGSGPSGYAQMLSSSSLDTVQLPVVAQALDEIATLRAKNGAEQNVIGFATEFAVVNAANLEAAKSRILDVDVAEEATTLARFNILVQAGTAMLSQANQSAQTALKLLAA